MKDIEGWSESVCLLYIKRLEAKARENLNLTPIEGILQRLIAQSFRMHPAALAIQQQGSIAQHTATCNPALEKQHGVTVSGCTRKFLSAISEAVYLSQKKYD